jgi:hypothetical protein
MEMHLERRGMPRLPDGGPAEDLWIKSLRTEIKAQGLSFLTAFLLLQPSLLNRT